MCMTFQRFQPTSKAFTPWRGFKTSRRIWHLVSATFSSCPPKSTRSVSRLITEKNAVPQKGTSGGRHFNTAAPSVGQQRTDWLAEKRKLAETGKAPGSWRKTQTCGNRQSVTDDWLVEKRQLSEIHQAPGATADKPPVVGQQRLSRLIRTASSSWTLKTR